MSTQSHRHVTGFLLIVAPILFITAFTMLQVNFEYPDILGQPAAIVLEKFIAGGNSLLATWYVMVISAILFIPISIMTHPYIVREDTPYATIATSFGVLAGVVQMLGFVRWIFLVPSLAVTYLNPSTSEAVRAAVEVTFNAFNQYAGVAVGEHLGFLFTALWTILISLTMPKSKLFSAWLAWMGIISATGILVGMLEPAGVQFAGPVNAIAYIIWAIWLVILGVRMIFEGRRKA